MLLQPLAGALSDRIGRKPLMIGFGVLGVLPHLSDLRRAGERCARPHGRACSMLAALVIVTGYTSINAVVKAELFPAHIRALGVALPYALANALFGGTAEYAALWFKEAGWERGFYLVRDRDDRRVAHHSFKGIKKWDTAKHSRILEE